ncbi:ribonuclease Z [Puia dinghuensis]|uniref:Ribonuclease Z n=1 Tax=Puia dinghuensis TaxID=1792502 RepID=A0A8J2XWD4_9BACT|nr:ribonuclease Z [Puia dinghuensis]GGB25582.1 ribonuclease Z [Puia dinghuensis]
MLAVTILGNNSALPAFDRHPTAQVVTMEDQIFLVDCGEGTQMQMAKYKIRRSKINYIFISHLHGDHYFGLIGLLTSMGLLGRTQELHIYAPPPLQDIIGLQLKVADIELAYPLHFHHLTAEGVILREARFEVSCFPVYHRIECWGFCFREVRPLRRVNPEKARQNEVPASFFDRLKWGENYLRKDGVLVDNLSVTDPAPKAKSYAYAADTLYDERIAEQVRGVDLLYHETTYLKDLGEQAGKRFHSTTEQAARIACIAGVQRLLIGHFSSKYEKLQVFEQEARDTFPNTELAMEGVTYKI